MGCNGGNCEDSSSKRKIDKILNRVGIVYQHISEQGFEPFRQLSLDNPERAIQEFPDYLDRVLSAGEDLFRGMMCGGPYPEATAPLLNSIGTIYPHLSRALRTQALKRSLGFLDHLNYFNAQNNVELIDEPLLFQDILVNRSLYWPGFPGEKLKPLSSREKFEEAFLINGEGGWSVQCASLGWLCYAASRVDCGYDVPFVRDFFVEHLPEIVDNTKGFAAALAIDHAYGDVVQKKGTYEAGVERRLTDHYPEDWQEDLRKKVSERDWIWLPQRKHELGLEVS